MYCKLSNWNLAAQEPVANHPDYIDFLDLILEEKKNAIRIMKIARQQKLSTQQTKELFSQIDPERECFIEFAERYIEGLENVSNKESVFIHLKISLAAEDFHLSRLLRIY